MKELTTELEVMKLGVKNDELAEFRQRQPENEGEIGSTESDWAAIE